MGNHLCKGNIAPHRSGRQVQQQQRCAAEAAAVRGCRSKGVSCSGAALLQFSKEGLNVKRSSRESSLHQQPAACIRQPASRASTPSPLQLPPADGGWPLQAPEPPAQPGCLPAKGGSLLQNQADRHPAAHRLTSSRGLAWSVGASSLASIWRSRLPLGRRKARSVAAPLLMRPSKAMSPEGSRLHCPNTPSALNT